MYRRIDRFSFIFGIVIIGPVITLGLLIKHGFFDFIHGINLCAFNRTTGLYCPGCGMTRACFALMGGHPFLSIAYHIIPISSVLIYFIYMSYLIYMKIRLKRKGLTAASPYPDDMEKISRLFHKRLEISVYVVLGITTLVWIARNILLIAYKIDWFDVVNQLKL